MAQIITAPSIELPKFKSVFLAGGITNCKEWQKAVIRELEFEDISFFNPRQEHFDVSDKNASYNQILWEFERLEKMDIFSMYYCNDNSDQPICMYELGRNISEIKKNYSKTWEHRIIISVEKGYKREQDVFIQTRLATNSIIKPFSWATPVFHAMAIVNNYDWLLKNI